MKQSLSKRQESILRFIIQQVQLLGYPPAVREIGNAVGLQSSSTVHTHLTQLEKKGYIARDPSKPRAIMVLRDCDGNPFTKENTPATLEIVAEEPKETFDEVVNLPLYGNVAAGAPIYADNNIEDIITFPMRFVRHNNSFMLKIKGESMINAGIFDGDYIIVAPQKTARNGEIIVAMIDGEATCKTFYQEANRVRLQPENDFMEPIYAEQVEILGKVISLFRNMQ